MAWLSGPNPFFQESKNYKNLTLKRKKFTKTKAKKICPRSQDSCQFSPNLLSRHDATVPERSWSPVASYQLPVAKLQGDDPLGFVLLLSVSRNQAKEREPFSAEYPKKEPLQEPRKKEKICWKCSRTFSFNDKMVLFASWCVAFSIWRRETKTVSWEIPPTAQRTLLVRSHQYFPLMSLSKPPPSFCYRALLPCRDREKKLLQKHKGRRKNMPRGKLKHKKEQLRRWKKAAYKKEKKI